ncbi:MAG: hypothetical protein IIU55_00090 [Paludibacteraceae bacterium]|nr:hypothetical protein [Paludibacteraceae bacterium]
MKKTIVLAFMAMAMVAVPATAQTRKDKKAAEKAQWEQEQKFAAEEAALRHQIRMDSIANAKRVAEEQAAAAAAKAKAEADAKAAQEVEVSEPCEEYYSTKDLIRGRGVAESPIQQVAMAQARVLAVEEFAAQVQTTVQSVATNNMAALSGEDGMEVKVLFNNKTKNIVDQTTGFRIVCRKTTTSMKNGTKIYRHYMVVELDMETILKPLYDEIQKDEATKLELTLDEFSEEFEKHFPIN